MLLKKVIIMIIWNVVFLDKFCVVNIKYIICDFFEIGLYLWYVFFGDVEGGVLYLLFGAFVVD